MSWEIHVPGGARELNFSLPTPTLHEVEVLTSKLAEMAVAEERREHREVPDLGNLPDELHSCCVDAEFSFIVFPAR